MFNQQPKHGVILSKLFGDGPSVRASEALTVELGSQALGHWMRWVDASSWLAKDTLSYVQRLQAEFVRATQELQAHSQSGEQL